MKLGLPQTTQSEIRINWATLIACKITGRMAFSFIWSLLILMLEEKYNEHILLERAGQIYDHLIRV